MKTSPIKKKKLFSEMRDTLKNILRRSIFLNYKTEIINHMQKKIISYAVIFALAFLPSIYLLMFSENALVFYNFSGAMRSIGKIFGLAGIVLFSITFLLNTRIKLVEEMFFGLDKTLNAHHIFGTTAFVFLLFHPLFLSAQFLAFSIKSTLIFLIPFSNPAVTFGSLALLSMTIILIITFFAKWKYQNWKFSHQLLGVSFILASIHVLLIPSDVSNDLFLKIYIILFLAIGLISYSYRTLFWRAFVKRHDYLVKKIRRLGEITEITLEPSGKPLSFKPGQFVFVSFNKRKMKETHPFTISSSSSDKTLILSIKNLGDYTYELKNMMEGIKVKIEGPYGKFSFMNSSSKRYIFIAGGIGITPFLSMLRSIGDSPESFDFEEIALFYSVKKKEEAVFLDELNKISQKNKKIKVFLYESAKKGHLNSEYILENNKDFKKAEIFICGPASMMNSLKEQLINDGVNKHKINLEEFSLL